MAKFDPKLTSHVLTTPAYELTPWALEELAKSGITATIAVSHQLRSVPAGNGGLTALYPILNRTWDAEWGEALLFPYFDEHGKLILWRAKLQWPRGLPDGEAKYMAPKESKLHYYFTNGAREYLRGDRRNKPVYFPEGEKKALLLCQHGEIAIGIPGTCSWHKPKAKRTLHSDIQVYDLHGFRVRLPWDSDVERNESDRGQRARCCQAFREAGADAEIISIPDTANDPTDFDGAKRGVDDVFIQEGEDGLRRLLEDAEYILDQGKPKIGKDPLEHALVCQHSIEQDGRKLVYWNGVFIYEPSTKQWNDTPTERMHQTALLALQETYSEVNTSHAIEAVAQTRAHKGIGVGVYPDAQPPIWLRTPPAGFEDTEDLLVTRDHVVRLTPPRLVIPRSDDLFAPTFVNVAYDPDATCEPFHEFLNQTFVEQYAKDILLEYWATTLTPSMKLGPSATGNLHKILLILGPQGCGKTVFITLMTLILGEAHVIPMTLKQLNSRFGGRPLLGKSMCVMEEELANCKEDACGLLLRISGGGRIAIEGKGKDIVDAKLFTRFVMVNNEMVKLSAVGMARRLLPIQACKNFTVDIPNMADKLFQECGPGILNEILAARERLKERGFTPIPPGSISDELLRDQMQLSVPEAQFLHDELTLGATCRAGVKDVFSRWRAWRHINGEPTKHTTQSLSAKLRALVPGLRVEQPSVRTETGERQRERVYVGFELKEPDPTVAAVLKQVEAEVTSYSRAGGY